MKKEPTYTSDGKYSVFCGETEIARSYVKNEGEDGMNEVRILQGMPRMETVEKILRDCPEFFKNNEMDLKREPKLFSAPAERKKNKKRK